jgi:hypothetical protein
MKVRSVHMYWVAAGHIRSLLGQKAIASLWMHAHLIAAVGALPMIFVSHARRPSLISLIEDIKYLANLNRGEFYFIF